MKTEHDRAKAFLNQFENPSQCADPRSFGLDGSNQYYNLLYSIAKDLQPKFVIELGTCTGGSTSHLAAGTSGKVLSIDIEILRDDAKQPTGNPDSSGRPDAKERLLAFDNIELLHGDTRSPELVAEVAKRGPIDLLFIDTDHTAEQVTAELSLFGSLVRPGGIIFFDDIRISPEMSAWWDSLEEDKLELPEMHWTGFGVVFVGEQGNSLKAVYQSYITSVSTKEMALSWDALESISEMLEKPMKEARVPTHHMTNAFATS